MASLYNSVVYQHYANPRNKGKLKNPSETFDGQNLSCGDQVTFYVKLNPAKKITAAMWEGSGCAISQASASLLSEMIIGKTLAQVKKMNASTLMKKLDTPLSPSRVKCATLPLYTIKGIEE